MSSRVTARMLPAPKSMAAPSFRQQWLRTMDLPALSKTILMQAPCCTCCTSTGSSVAKVGHVRFEVQAAVALRLQTLLLIPT